MPQLQARNVVAFLDDDETAGTLRDLCRDSRMTPPRVQGGGLDAALEHHALIGDVETILVDTDSSLMPTADIAALRTVVADHVRIVTLGAGEGARSGYELLAAGADRHLGKPVSRDELIAELFEEVAPAAPPAAEPPAVEPPAADPLPEARKPIQAPHRESLPSAPPQESHSQSHSHSRSQPHAPTGAPRRIVVLGAHSGVGGTTLAVNLAALLARDSADETLLLDLDLQFGTALLLLNRQPSTALGHMLREPSRIDRVLVRHAAQEAGKHLSVIGAEESLSPMAPIDPDAVATLIAEAGDAFHNLIVDLPAHRLELLAPCLATASDVVLVSDFTLAGVRDVWRMHNEILRHAPADSRCHLVIGGAVDAGDRVMSASEFEHNTGMKIAARLPHDPTASGEAGARGKPVVLAKPQSRIARAYGKLARGFLPAPRRRGLRLFGKRQP